MEIIGTCFFVTNFGHKFGIRKVELFKCHDPKWLSDKITSEVEKNLSAILMITNPNQRILHLTLDFV